MKRRISLSIFIFASVFIYAFSTSQYAINFTQLISNSLNLEADQIQLLFSSENNLKLEQAGCKDPTHIILDEIGDSFATLSWDDANNTQWEYFVQPEGVGTPSFQGGSTVNNKKTKVTATSQGVSLLPGEAYEFYVRSKCADGTLGTWIGPFIFKTNCSAFATFPFTESFNTTSLTFNCWRMVNKTAGSWGLYSYDTYEGDRCINFSTSKDEAHDNWLISPTLDVSDGGVYELSFYYRTITSSGGEFELLLSDTGIETAKFSTVIAPKKHLKIGKYIKATYYIKGYIKPINLAWRINNQVATTVYLDEVKVSKVDCVGPSDDIVVSAISTTSAQVSWNDKTNSTWEYVVQVATGIAPIGSGTLTTTNPLILTRTTGTTSAPLQPGSNYEFYIRSVCDSTKKGNWIGPISFRTACNAVNLPYREGFNLDSPTLDCWSIVDRDEKGERNFRLWTKSTTAYEGNQSMYYFGTGGNHDTWLVSPSFNLDPLKSYRLKYFYKTHPKHLSDFELKLSTKGTDLSNFTTVLSSKKGESSDNWKQETIIISKMSGTVNLAWHVTTKTDMNHLYLDLVTLEEIDCVEPTQLGVTSITPTSVNLKWNDVVNTSWEYSVQAKNAPVPTSNGTTSTTTTATVTVDAKGNPLTPNTEYEYYVRALCVNGSTKFSPWIGPLVFRTACLAVNLPFWEGFNNDSSTVFCWEFIDGNKDATGESNSWRRYNFTQHEGSHTMIFEISDAEGKVDSDDWLISPEFVLDSKKIYRLKYHYRGANNEANYFEVLASNNGKKTVNFTKEIVKEPLNKNVAHQEKKAFISNYGGNVHLAWHTKGTGSKMISIDNIFLEEVTTCPEPLNLAVINVGKNTAELVWTDDFKANSWEYYVQDVNLGIPTTKGTTTNVKTNKVGQDQSGNALKPNTDYEFYARTLCGDGSYSPWSGPFSFTTLCDVYQTPFWEGFNQQTTSWRCWTIEDGNKDNLPWRINASDKYEGNQGVNFNMTDFSGIKTNNDWLISPLIQTTNDLYVLKYHYKTNATNGGEFRVVLSNNGLQPSEFKQTLLATEKYKVANWTEKVVFFTSPGGNINVAWHANGVGSSKVSIDNITIAKVDNCPEPYYVKTLNMTSTTIDVEWQQDTAINTWEVILVPYGEDETATPIQTKTVTGNPMTSFTNLSPSSNYTIYVRAVCLDGQTKSSWSTPHTTSTLVGANDDCAGALTIPVNPTLECNQFVSGTLVGATTSNIALGSCAAMKNDIWFEFTAVKNMHLFTLESLVSLSGAVNTKIVVALYNQPCSALNATTPPVSCATLDMTTKQWTMMNLIPGQKYFLRLGLESKATKTDFLFKFCIGTAEYDPMEVSPSGGKYTVEELVTDVLINSPCKLVSNISYQIGDGSPATTSVNTLGYFNKGKSNFPFQEGIVLSTGQVQYVPGPFQEGNRGSNPHRWTGDKDLNDAINDAGGNPEPDGSMRVTQLEFDFIPVKDSINFDYLFASNSYGNCAYTCANGALFAAWLIDTTTGIGQNLAKIKNTKTPIALGTIWDSSKIEGSACNSYPELFWNGYPKSAPPIVAPFNFSGSTIAMSSETVHVVPGRSYHIKLAVMDFCKNDTHTSAVFFNAGSFNLGTLDLGEDLLIENGNALCGGACQTLQSGLNSDDVSIQWYKDGVAIQGATSTTYEVCESGVYTVEGKYENIDCTATGEVKIEINPMLKDLIKNPQNLPICRKTTHPILVDLSVVLPIMFDQVSVDNYQIDFFELNKEDEPIADATQYEIKKAGEAISIKIRVEDKVTKCVEYFDLQLLPTKGEMPIKPQDVVSCDRYVLPKVEVNQHYFDQSGGKGNEYQSGTELAPGSYTLYLFQDNGNSCYEEEVFTIEVVASPSLLRIQDQYLECELFVLPDLPEHNTYYTLVGDQRVALSPGTIISNTNTTIFIVMESENKICVEETSFVVRYAECPIPKGISPNNDGLNDYFDLSLHGVSSLKIFNRLGVEVYSFQGKYTKEWQGQSSSGKDLPSGTYFYVLESFNKKQTGWVEINR